MLALKSPQGRKRLAQGVDPLAAPPSVRGCRVFRSARYVYAQAIDDTTGRVLAAACELEEKLKAAVAGKPKKERARAIGKAIGEQAQGCRRHGGRVRPQRLHLSRPRQGGRRWRS